MYLQVYVLCVCHLHANRDAITYVYFLTRDNSLTSLFYSDCRNFAGAHIRMRKRKGKGVDRTAIQLPISFK